MDSGFVYAAFTVVGLVVTALATFYVARKYSTRDYAATLTNIIQALEVSNRQLREELDRVSRHRDQLLAEQASIFKAIVLDPGRKGEDPRRHKDA